VWPHPWNLLVGGVTSMCACANVPERTTRGGAVKRAQLCKAGLAAIKEEASEQTNSLFNRGTILEVEFIRTLKMDDY